MRQTPRLGRLHLLLLGAAVAAGCGDDTPKPRPGEPVATGRIEHFWWLGPSAGLAYAATNADFGADIRAVDLATGADAAIVSTHWDPRPAVPVGGAPALYYIDTEPTADPVVSSLLRGRAGEPPDTILEGLAWVAGGLAVTTDERRISYTVQDSVVVVDREEGARRTWPVTGTDAHFSPAGDRLLILYRWYPYDQRLVDIDQGEIAVSGVSGLNFDVGDQELPVAWADGSPHMLYVDPDGRVKDHDLLTGESETRFTLPREAIWGDLAWSPDRDRIVYRTLECTDMESRFFVFESECVEWAVRLVMRDRGGREDVVAVLLTSFSDWHAYRPHFSPDGTRLAYLAPDPSASEWDVSRILYVVRLP